MRYHTYFKSFSHLRCTLISFPEVGRLEAIQFSGFKMFYSLKLVLPVCTLYLQYMLSSNQPLFQINSCSLPFQALVLFQTALAILYRDLAQANWYFIFQGSHSIFICFRLFGECSKAYRYRSMHRSDSQLASMCLCNRFHHVPSFSYLLSSPLSFLVEHNFRASCEKNGRLTHCISEI